MNKKNLSNVIITTTMIICMVMLMLMMMLITDQVNWGEWNLPMRVCDFYLAMDVVCSTSSIFHLVAISIDR